MFCISCHFGPLKPLTLRMDHVKLLDVLTSLPVCCATSHPPNQASCSYISGSGKAYEPFSRYCPYHFLLHDYIQRKTVMASFFDKQWLSGVCLTRYRGVAGSSLTGGTAMCPWARPFILCLVLVQHKKTHPDMTEKIVDWDVKNQNKQASFWHWSKKEWGRFVWFYLL